MASRIRYIVRPVDVGPDDALTSPHFGVHATDGEWLGGAIAWAVRERDAGIIADALTAHRAGLSEDVQDITRTVTRASESRPDRGGRHDG